MATAKFNIRLHDGGWQGMIEVGTGVYMYAAAAVPAILGLNLPLDFEIWSVIPEIADKRFNFRVTEDEFGQLVVQTLVPNHERKTPLSENYDVTLKGHCGQS